MILISAGHNPDAPGACFPYNNRGYCEHEVAKGWVNYINLLVKKQIASLLVPTGSLTFKVNWVNNQCRLQKIKMLAVELHFNGGGGGRAQGSETLYCPGSSKGMVAASVVQRHLGAVMTPDRGVKEGWYRMDIPGVEDYPGDVDGDEKKNYFLEKTYCVALIIEAEFIYNRKSIESGRTKACEAIAAGLLEAYEHA